MANGKVLFFDVETVPIQNSRAEHLAWLTEKVQKYNKYGGWEDTDIAAEIQTRLGTTPEMVQVVGLTVAVDEGHVRSAWVGEVLEDGTAVTEQFLLDSWWKLTEGKEHICSFNGSYFDLPVLLHRSAMLNITPRRHLYDLKPWENLHIDVFRRRWPGGAKYQMGLKDLGRELNLPLPPALKPLLAMDGGQVEELWLAAQQTNDYTVPKQYGLMDVYLLRELARLWGGYFFPQILVKWDSIGIPYNYQTGEWLAEAPGVFGDGV